MSAVDASVLLTVLLAGISDLKELVMSFLFYYGDSAVF
jgi:hypothetical protein